MSVHPSGLTSFKAHVGAALVSERVDRLSVWGHTVFLQSAYSVVYNLCFSKAFEV